MWCKMTGLLLIFIICSAPAVLSQDPRSSTGHYCYVQAPSDLSIFNLTTIQHDHNDSTIRLNDNEHLRVHFCRPLKDPCNGQQDYAVCLHDNDKEIGVGKEPPNVAVESGKIMFRYIGVQCNETHNYTVDFEMKCNFAMKDKVAVDLDIVYNRDQCGFQMSIETAAACAKKRETTCELTSDSSYYNLSPLTNVADNYKIKLNHSLSIILNVCHSLIYGEHFHQCNHETMVCLVDETNTNETRYTKLGNINNAVRMTAVDGAVYLDLTSDTLCQDKDGKGTKTIRTTIEFVCKKDAVNKTPKYRSGYGTCHYRLRWPTVSACSEDVLIEQSEINRQPCKILDPVYSRLYDLSMLEGKYYFSNSSDKNAEYQFSICSPLRESNCTKPGTAVCKYLKDKKIGISEGVGNTNLMWRRGRIFLNYTDGVACGNNRRRHTTIVFHCGPRNSLLIDDQDPCHTTITWTTNMVCNHRCATPDLKINLDKLGRVSNNYVTQGDNKTIQYHMNICEPLVENHFVNCTGDIGICKVVVDEDGKRMSETNLGYADTGLRLADDGRIYLTYLNGSVCEEDTSRRISTEITFLCDVESESVGHIFLGLGEPFLMSDAFFNFLKLYQGFPIFKRYNNCKYEFNWRTGFVCGQNDQELSKECLMANNIEIFNITQLVTNSLFKVNTEDSTGYFNVSVCGRMNKCNGSFVCDNKNFFGNVDHRPPPTKNLVVFKFANETKCKNNIFYNSVLKIWCNIWSGVAESFLLKEGECNIELEWATNNPGCNFNGNATETAKGKRNSSSPSTVILMMTVIVGSAIIVVTLYYYRHGYRRRLCFNVSRNYVNDFVLVFTRREPQPTENLAT